MWFALSRRGWDVKWVHGDLLAYIEKHGRTRLEISIGAYPWHYRVILPSDTEWALTPSWFASRREQIENRVMEFVGDDYSSSRASVTRLELLSDWLTVLGVDLQQRATIRSHVGSLSFSHLFKNQRLLELEFPNGLQVAGPEHRRVFVSSLGRDQDAAVEVVEEYWQLLRERLQQFDS